MNEVDNQVSKETKASDNTSSKVNRKGAKVTKRTKSKGDKLPSKNDWSWYAISDEVARDFGSIPFNVLPGSRVTMGTGDASSVEERVIKYGGVMRINYVPAIDVTGNDDLTSGINTASIQLYTYTRHANSGAKVYEPADQMMYLLAMRDIYAEVGELARALRMVSFTPLQNKFYPHALITAMGLDYADLVANAAAYRGRLNIIISKVNGLAVPKVFKAMDRAAYISNFAFGDSSQIRGQVSVFTKAGYYLWTPISSDKGSQLTYVKRSAAKELMSLRLKNLDNQIQKMLIDSDVLTMSGDILKAFGPNNLYGILEIKESDVLAPIFDENINSQIENLSIATGFSTASAETFNVTQENGVITWQPTYISSAVSAETSVRDFILNTHKENPDYKDVLEYTRLINCVGVSSGSDGKWVYTLYSCGLELVTQLDYVVSSPEPTWWQTITLSNNVISGSATSIASGNLLTALALTQLDYHPTIYCISEQDETVIPVTDLDKWTILSWENVVNINKAAVAGAWYAVDLYKAAKPY